MLCATNIETLRRIRDFLAHEAFQPRGIVEHAAAPVIVENEEIDALAVADLLQMRDGRARRHPARHAEEHDLAHEAAWLDIVRMPSVMRKVGKSGNAPTLPQTSVGSAGLAGLSRHSREPSRPGMKMTGRRAVADGVCA